MLVYLSFLALFCLQLDARIFEKIAPKVEKERVGDAPTCSQGWEEYFQSDQCIKAFTTKSDYFEAEITCNKQGGHLVSIHNGFQNQQVLATSQTAFTQCRYWIGANRFGDFASTRTRASRRDADYPWAWMDKSSFNYLSWKSGFPDSSQNSPDCAFMDVESGARWANNGSCAERNCFVCEKPQEGAGTTPAPLPTTGNPWFTGTYQTTGFPWWTTAYPTGWWTDGTTTTPCPQDYTTQPWWASTNWPQDPTQTTPTYWWTTQWWNPTAQTTQNGWWTTQWGVKQKALSEFTTNNPWGSQTTTRPWWLTTYNPCTWAQRKKNSDKTPNTFGTAMLKLFGFWPKGKSTKN